MSTQFGQTIRLAAGCTALLLFSLASTYVYHQLETEQLAQQNPSEEDLSLAGQDYSALSRQQISSSSSQTSSILNASFPNPSTTQSVDETKYQQNTSLLGQELAQGSSPYSVIDEFKKYKFSIQGSKVLAPGKLPAAKVNFNQSDLLAVLVNTRKYYQDHASADPDILRAGLLATQGVTVEDTLSTLDFMISILQEDIANRRATRLQDSNFINKNFRVIKWSPHNPKNTSQKQLRMTKYAVFTHAGSRKKTSDYNIPIYSLKDELTADKFYTKYTKQDILSGIYEPGGKEFGKVEPLVYLTRTGMEEALMEGTILIKFTDGSKAFFNVDRSNEMPYVKGIKPREQKRYWYFRKVEDIKGYGYKIDAKISIKPRVTFAGDVLNIGLGRVILLESGQAGSKQLRMGVVADTGGAFLPNLYQLDFLAGIFPTQNDFKRYVNQLPEYATAYILVKK
jgi:hypothetical protein